MRENRIYTQVLIIGSGIAGCTSALTAADKGLKVTLVCAGEELSDGNSSLAQGGIVFRSKDDRDHSQLREDILTAGWANNYLHAVKYLCRKGPQLVQEILIDKLGVPFNKDASGEWDLAREGGHAVPRILHCADYTGRMIMDALIRAVTTHQNISVLTNRTAVDLLTSHHHASLLEYKYHLVNQCLGAYVLNQTSGQVETVLADYTVLATGGAGRIWLHTTNSGSSIGSALAMVYRAGAKLMNMEYVQFHPTSLLHRAERRFLISEAVRGAGARLVDSRREPFMHKYDSRGDLAPRDIVTRAIIQEMLLSGANCVYLDAARYAKADLINHFPTIANRCKEIGVDITQEPIPVVPAAHYFCGGVLVDVRGRSTLSRLYAVGECACTGVHGANRLASTSLLEGLLWGWSSGVDIKARLNNQSHLTRKLRNCIPDWVTPGRNQNEDPALIAQDWALIRNTMWNYVGIMRSTSRLNRAFEDMRDLNKRLHDFYRETPMSKTLVDLFHGSHAAYLVTMYALRNTKSLGCHYRTN